MFHISHLISFSGKATRSFGKVFLDAPFACTPNRNAATPCDTNLTRPSDACSVSTFGWGNRVNLTWLTCVKLRRREIRGGFVVKGHCGGVFALVKEKRKCPPLFRATTRASGRGFWRFSRLSTPILCERTISGVGPLISVENECSALR